MTQLVKEHISQDAQKGTLYFVLVTKQKLYITAKKKCYVR